ncbi:MAG: M28 family peptidase [bacterium]|nr:M28 family peptidase [bacterium]
MPMNKAQLRRDIEYLAGDLPHRGANTHNERAAAEYIRERMESCTADTETDGFFSPGSRNLLFASYFVEFVFVAVLGYWWPFTFAGYGLFVFASYVVEFSGYNLFARFLPQYETQNVTARFMGTRPLNTIVVTAHYDSAVLSPLNRIGEAGWLRAAHAALIAAMVVVIASCLAQGFGIGLGAEIRYDLIVRGAALAFLICASAFLVWCDQGAEHTRGATNNASGVAVLLGLAEQLRERPMETADVWLVATGSTESGLNGIRRLLSLSHLRRSNTYVVSLDRLGTGDVRYVTGEGMLTLFRSAPELVKVAREAGASLDVGGMRRRGIPSEACLALTRGYKTMGISTEETGRTHESLLDEMDRPWAVDYETVQRAADFTEALLRKLEQDLAAQG